MSTLESRLEVCARRADVPAAIVPILVVQAPWLDGESEVSEALAPELLGGPFAMLGLGNADVMRFIEAHNEAVRSRLAPPVEVQHAAYAACLAALAPFGTDHEDGGKDFWVVPDALAERPLIQLLPGFTLPQEGIAALREVAETFADFYSAVDVTNEDGDLIIRCSPTSPK